MYVVPSTDMITDPYVWYLKTEIKIDIYLAFLTGENSDPSISSGDRDSVRKGEICFKSSSGSEIC